MAIFSTIKTFFEAVDAVVRAGWIGEATDAVKIIALKVVVGGVFNHVPLD